MFPYLAIWSDWSLLVLRVALGAVLIAHGWPKIKDLKQTAQNFQGMGFRPGGFWAVIVAVTEFVGGLAILTGIADQPAAFFVTLEFIVIIFWRIGRKHPFVGGWELDVLMLASALTVLLFGSGMYSLWRFMPTMGW